MRKSVVSAVVVSLALVLAFTASAQAVSIGINLATGDASSQVSSSLSDGYVAQTNWNNANMQAGCAFVSGPVDSTGAAVTSGLSLGLDLAWGGGWSYYYAVVSQGSTNANTLGNSGWEAQYGPIVHLNNIPYSSYSVAVLTGFYGYSDMKWEVETGLTTSSYTTPSYRNGGGGFYALQIIDTGSGHVAAPNFQAAPATLTFTNAGVSTVSPAQTVTITNIGDAAGDITSVGATGGFTVTPATGTTVAANGGTALFDIQLPAQTAPGTYTGVATIVTATGTFNYDLSETVIAHDGDVNGDGQVSLLDYNIVKVNFGNSYESGNHWNDGDVNSDGQVGLLDYNLVKAHFGHTTGDTGVTAVPEPATLSLLALAGLAALRRKR